jgi:pyridinium-3,5-biscarboxylic acid mononucleotide sulfurtransferase
MLAARATPHGFMIPASCSPADSAPNFSNRSPVEKLRRNLRPVNPSRVMDARLWSVIMNELTAYFLGKEKDLAAELQAKIRMLGACIGAHRRVLIAFSGGVDSTFLTWCCARILGGANVLAVTAVSETYPRFEHEEAVALTQALAIPHRVLPTRELARPGFSENTPDRCYHCKKELLTLLVAMAAKEGYDAIFEGGNLDDLADYRPGRRAVLETGASSPLLAAKLGKMEIRHLSRLAALATADKPAYACLASRFPYGEPIDDRRLRRVEEAEAGLRRLGFTQFRVRSHGDCARVEMLAADMAQAWRQRQTIEATCRQAGFIFSALDLQGYRPGAMNEALPANQKSGNAHDQ